MSDCRVPMPTYEGIPYMAVGAGEEESTILSIACECGHDVEFSFAEMMRCFRDDDRPRPVCKRCGRPVEIGHARVLRDGEMVDL